jgi:hypothetical protein
MFAKEPKPDPELQALLQKLAKQSKDGGLEQQNAGNSAPPRPEAGPDMEVWVRDQVLTAIRMGIALTTVAFVRADETALQAGIQGVANGAAIEILGTCGFDTKKLVNLRR